jgi:hypothetical protein
VESIADVAQPTRFTHRGTAPYSQACHPLPTRTPGEALARALANYPAPQLWEELRELVPRETAAKLLDAAVAAVRRG